MCFCSEEGCLCLLNLSLQTNENVKSHIAEIDLIHFPNVLFCKLGVACCSHGNSRVCKHTVVFPLKGQN